MKKSKFSESQITGVLKEHEAGKKAADICRELKISENTFYTWKRKYSGMDAEMLRRYKELERENSKLKQMYADLSLDHRILKDVIEKKL
jgi:putative transposase